MGTGSDRSLLIFQVLFVLILSLFVEYFAGMANCAHYSRSELLEIQACSNHKISRHILATIPQELRVKCGHEKYCFRRKRGQRGGIRRRLYRRKFKPPLPSIILANVRSVTNKIDELRFLAVKHHAYRDSCAIALTETWFSDHIVDDSVALENFALFRGDRTSQSGKSRGGGVALYVNSRWCTNAIVKNRVCTPDVEILCVQCRPFYLPREFSCVVFVVVYVPPSSDTTRAAESIADVTNVAANSKPDAPIIIVGDFNQCSLHDVLPTFQQFVNCATRDCNTLDLVYCNVKNAYKVRALPQLGRSDHIVLHAIPEYQQKLKTSKPIEREITFLDEEGTEKLRGCLACTDWKVLLKSSADLHEATEVVSGYIAFCTDVCSEKKTVKIYPNTKPWITGEIKQILREKHKLRKSGDKETMKSIQKKLEEKIKEGKRMYKHKLLRSVKQGDLRGTWQCLNTMTDRGKRSRQPDASLDFVTELNKFYCRFDKQDPLLEGRQGPPHKTEDKPITITEDEVNMRFKHISERKAAGPDGISNKVLKLCSKELAGVFCHLYNQSLNECRVPRIWKTSNIIPVPKKSNATEMNDFRPVALTPVPMKILEKIVKKHLMKDVEQHLDPMQFAYRGKRSVEDAIITLTHKIKEHLEQLNTYVRILFIDFSSAFNTISPAILHLKLSSFPVNSFSRQWILDFFLDRPQFVSVGTYRSPTLTVSTGAPQGCVLSPSLYAIYTTDCTARSDDNLVLKFADDTAVVGRVKDSDSEDGYYHIHIWARHIA